MVRLGCLLTSSCIIYFYPLLVWIKLVAGQFFALKSCLYPGYLGYPDAHNHGRDLMVLVVNKVSASIPLPKNFPSPSRSARWRGLGTVCGCRSVWTRRCGCTTRTPSSTSRTSTSSLTSARCSVRGPRERHLWILFLVVFSVYPVNQFYVWRGRD